MWPTDPPVDIEAVAARARRLGPVPYSSLRLPSGHSTGTSAPAAGAKVAARLDRWWHELGRPDPFVVEEDGAGDGSLAAAVMAASPACAPALRYVLVEPDPARRNDQRGRVHLEPPASALGPVSLPAGADEEPEPEPGRGPLATSLAEPPAMGVSVVLAVGWLSALPWDLWERRGRGWVEVRLGAAADGGLVELSVPALGGLVVGEGLRTGERPAIGARSTAAEVAEAVEEGRRVPIQAAATKWLAEALRRVGPGRVAVIDRVVRSTAELAFAPGDPFPAPVVALDQLDRHRRAGVERPVAISPLVVLQWDVGSRDG